MEFTKYLLYLLTKAPKPEFLSDIAAFEGVAIAIIFPLSLEIISRISDRYNSEVIAKGFSEELTNRYLPYALGSSIILSIIFRFLASNDPASIYWKICSWLSLGFFIFNGFFLLTYLKVLKKYLISSKYTAEKLIKKAKDSFER